MKQEQTSFCSLLYKLIKRKCNKKLRVFFFCFRTLHLTFMYYIICKNGFCCHDHFHNEFKITTTSCTEVILFLLYGRILLWNSITYGRLFQRNPFILRKPVSKTTQFCILLRREIHDDDESSQNSVQIILCLKPITRLFVLYSDEIEMSDLRFWMV